MLYMPIIAAIETQIKKHSQLAKIWYYRFSLPESSVRTPFFCAPWVMGSEFSAHSKSCIADDISDMCIGNYLDKHTISIPCLVGVSKHNSYDAEELLDELQDAVIEQLKADRYLGGIVRFAEPRSMRVDSFIEISPLTVGAIIMLDVKAIDEQHETTLNWIEEILNPEFIVEETY